jgi:hypothetical protein
MNFTGSMNQSMWRRHANGLLLGKDGRVIIIEPSNNVLDAEYYTLFNNKILEFAKEVGVPDPKIIIINETCPQTIINKSLGDKDKSDSNCLFWTFFIYTKIVELEFDKDPNEAVAEYSSMPPEELRKLIHDFKIKLFTEIIPKGLEILEWRWPDFKELQESSEGFTLGASRKTRKNKRKHKMSLKLKTIRKSKKPAKKYDAVFETDGREKTVSFGAAGMSDFTKHKDETRKQRYINRHSNGRESWDKPDTAGALSRWILWNKTGFRASVADYKKRFNL